MTRYFRRVDDPHRLLARERLPVSGRRVPKVRSKRDLTSPAATASRAGVPVAAMIGGAVIAALVVTGVVVAWSRSSRSGDAVVATTVTTFVPAPTASVAAPIKPPNPDVGVTTTLVPATTVQVTSPLPAIATAIRLTSAAAASAATVIPTDPAATATYSGALPVFNFAIDCTADACNFSMRSFAPGTVTDEGLTTVPASAGRFLITSSVNAPCTTSRGNQLSREVSNVIDLTLSGTQVVNGVSVPQVIAGTLTSVKPDAGYVPKVGAVVDRSAEVGCPGQTLTFDVAGVLVPG
ncbi:MAG: hypothetical protein ABI949_08200 [Ilumatobacteraceae bacterium]